MSDIRAICFDLDDTFWAVGPVIARAEQVMHQFLAQHCPRVSAAVSVEDMRAARQRAALDHPHMGHDLGFLRLQTLLQQLQRFDYPAVLAEQAFDVFMTERNRVVLFEDVLPALQALKPRYRLLTASNGNADLGRIGIAEYFEHSVSARRVGVMKPDPRLFHASLLGQGLAPEQVVYVGDDPLLDVEGARAAGMQAVWVNREHRPWPVNASPAPMMVHTLSGLPAVLARI